MCRPLYVLELNGLGRLYSRRCRQFRVGSGGSSRRLKEGGLAIGALAVPAGSSLRANLYVLSFLQLFEQ